MDKVVFSVLLDYLIKNSSYSIKKLAEETNINRTVLQKYISGDRFPSSYANIEKIADKLTLSKQQREHLYNVYKIEKVGYHKYECLKSIKQIIENISYPKDVSDYDFNIDYTFDSVSNFATNKDELVMIVRYLINQAKQSKSHKIKVYLPKSNEIFKIIFDNLKSNSLLSMELLIKISTTEANQLDNIKQFENLLPIIFLDNCNIRYQYSDLSLMIENPFSFPYLISSDTYTLLINTDLTSGILLEKDINDYLSKQFDNSFNKADPFCKNITSVVDIVNYYVQSYDFSNPNAVNDIRSFSFEPCIVPNLDRYIIQEKYTGPQEYLQFIADFLLTYINKQLTHIKEGKKFVFYFTKSGLKSFYKTGRVSEIPNQFYKPFSKNEVILILKRMLNLAKKHSNYQFYIVKESKFNIPNKFSLVLNNKNDVLFSIGGKNDDTSVSIVLLEPILKNEFYSLTELIELEECYYDFEYSMQYLEDFIEEHR